MTYQDAEDMYGFQDDDFEIDFANPGSALRAGKREFPCPTCGRPNTLTAEDVQLGYQCDCCADIAEGKIFI